MGIEASVVVPTYNKVQDLELTLAGFNKQTIERDRFEVIVVDDGSSDGTREMVKAFEQRFRLHYDHGENRGRSAARNRGIEAARGDIIVFCDAEAIPDADFVEQHLRHHDDSRHGVVIGRRQDILSRWDSGLPESQLDRLLKSSDESSLVAERVHTVKAQGSGALLTRDDVEHNAVDLNSFVLKGPPGAMHKIIELYSAEMAGFAVPWVMFITVNASVKKSLLDTVGLFDETFSGWGMEDMELGYRLFKAGAGFAHAQSAVNYHQVHATEYDRRRQQQARNFGLFCDKHPALEVYLFWRFTRRKLPPDVYNNIVNEYYRWLDEGHTALADDYLSHCQKEAREYVVGAHFPQFLLG